MNFNIKNPLDSSRVQYQLDLLLDDIPRAKWDSILDYVEELLSQYERDQLFSDDVFTGITIGVLYIVVYNKRDLVYAENILGVIINEFIRV